jgi:enoyl-CoA hydratase/carnithine racemase
MRTVHLTRVGPVARDHLNRPEVRQACHSAMIIALTEAQGGAACHDKRPLARVR